MRKCYCDLPCVRLSNFKFVCTEDGHPIKEGEACIFHKSYDDEPCDKGYCYQCEDSDYNYELGAIFCKRDYSEKRDFDTCSHFCCRRR